MNIYHSLPRLRGVLANPNTRALGTLGEYAAMCLLRNAGYTVSNTRPGQHRGDLRVIDPETGEVLIVEVKTARQNSSKKWSFCLFREGKTDYRHADILIALAVLKSGDVIPFVIPTSAIPFRKKLVHMG